LSYSHTRAQLKVISRTADFQTERLGIKNEYRLSIQTWCYPFNTESEASYKKDLQVTLQVFFFALDREFFANSSPEVKHRHNLYPAVIPQNGITSPKL
jgi:hypothetical protein